MDLETAEAIETLRVDIRQVETSLSSRIGQIDLKGDHVEAGLLSRIQQVETSLRAEIQQVETSLHAEIQRVETSLRGEIRQLDSSLRTDLAQSLRTDLAQTRDEMKRYFDVVVESLRDDVRMIAEGLVALNAKVDALRQ